MANFIYKKAKQAMLSGQVNVIGSNLRVLLIDTNLYTANQNSDQYVSDIPISAIKKRSGNLANVSCNLGVLDADDLSIADHDGSSFNSIIVYQVGLSDSNSLLLFYIDSSYGLPFPGSAGISPVAIIWDNGPNKIISL